MRESIKLIYDSITMIFPQGLLLWILLASLVFLLAGRRRNRAVAFVGTTGVVFLLLFFCPVTAMLLRKLLRDGDVYWRLFWTVPYIVLVACAAVELLTGPTERAGTQASDGEIPSPGASGSGSGTEEAAAAGQPSADMEAATAGKPSAGLEAAAGGSGSSTEEVVTSGQPSAGLEAAAAGKPSAAMKAARAGMAAALVLVIVLGGGAVYRSDVFKAAPSKDKLPQITLTTVSVINDNAEKTGDPYKKLCAPVDVRCGVRQLDASILNAGRRRLDAFNAPKSDYDAYYYIIIDGLRPDVDRRLLMYLRYYEANYVLTRTEFGFRRPLELSNYHTIYDLDGWEIWYKPGVTNTRHPGEYYYEEEGTHS